MLLRSLFLFSFAAIIGLSRAQETNVIDAAMHHLGEKEVKAFPEANRKAEAKRLDLQFESQSNSTEWTLQLKQRDVLEDWGIEINGNRIGRLNIRESEGLASFSIPRAAIVDGTNTFSVVGNPSDDILVGAVHIVPQPLRDVLKLGHVTVNVINLSHRQPMPARITIASASNKFADLYNVKPNVAAWRKGIVYTTGAPVEFDLPEGDWIITATRGTEWSRPRQNLRVFIGQKTVVTLPLLREVDTTGFIAADTHLHTYTFSGHGDSTVDERIVTLAGEGVELAVATDHNHFTDYKPSQDKLGLSPYYKAVIGNEVTTSNGHLNGFPFNTNSVKPNYKETNWVKLVADIRAQGAQYVILNHPRWPTITNSPMAKWGLNRADGTRTNEMAFTFDAMEVLNSTVPLKDPSFVLHDWFALLNRGEHIWVVGASDTHAVADPPGQGRTYIASATDDPATIDVDATIKEMHAGHMSVSYGIFGSATLDAARMGDLVTPKGTNLTVHFRVACANWIPAREAVVYVNGRKAASQDLFMRPGGLLDTNLIFNIPTPAHDAYIVCVAYGKGVPDASWKTLHDYTLAVTNPIFIDADDDNKYSSPRDNALAVLNKTGNDLAKIEKTLTDLDPAIGIQLLSESKLRIPVEQLPAWTALLDKIAPTDALYQTYKSPMP